MILLKYTYEKIKKKPAPYYYDYSIISIIGKPIRKWITNVIAPNCVFNNFRILLYRISGFKIGKNVFIGMHCYLDDLCHELLIIEDNVTVSYGVYFACHGKNQKHFPIVIKEGAYIGMRASIISNNADKTVTGVVIGRDSIIGSCCLVNKNIPDNATAVGVPCKITMVRSDGCE